MSRIARHIATLILAIVSLVAHAQVGESADTATVQFDDDHNHQLNSYVTLGPDEDIEDTISVSILTCSPGDELYSRFGHTAIRVKQTRLYLDIVLNYGCFNYNSDNFVVKFLLGQTDYLLEGESYASFIRRYESMGQGVKEQVLNLSPEEEQILIDLLRKNLQPENQQYRYVWLYDNCTERARDVIEQAIRGNVVYEKKADKRTVRELLKSTLDEDSPWVLFGLNLILGQEIDATPPDRRVQMFLPLFYSEQIDSAVIKREGQTPVSMVKRTVTALESDSSKVEEPLSIFLRPVVVFLVLLLIVVIITMYEISRVRYLWMVDVVFHSIQGIAGILVAFLFFFSKHPGTDSNWLVIMFNPLWLAYAIWIAHCQRKMKQNRLGVANMVVTAIFLIIMVTCKQMFRVDMMLLIVTLMLRASIQGHFMFHVQFKHRASQKRLKGKE